MKFKNIILSFLISISFYAFAQGNSSQILMLSSFPVGGSVTSNIQPNMHLKEFKKLIESSTSNALQVAEGRGIQDGLLQVGSGRAQMLWTQSGYFVEKEFSFTLFNQPPFITAQEYLKWRGNPEVIKIADALYAKYGVKALPCSIIDYGMDFILTGQPNEDFPLIGKRIAISGPARDIFTATGLSIFPAPWGEINQLMKSSLIDGANLWSPHESNLIRADEAAKTVYFPSVIRRFTAVELFINLKYWNELSAVDRGKYETACQKTIAESLISSKKLAFDGIDKNRKAGISILSLPQKAVDSVQSRWFQMAAERALIDPVFNSLYQSLYSRSPSSSVSSTTEKREIFKSRCEVSFQQNGNIVKPITQDGWAQVKLNKNEFNIVISPIDCRYVMASVQEAATIDQLTKLPEFVFSPIGTAYAGTAEQADTLTIPSRKNISIPFADLSKDDRYLNLLKTEAQNLQIEPIAITPWGSGFPFNDQAGKSIASIRRLNATTVLDSNMSAERVPIVIYLLEKKLGGEPVFLLIKPFKAVLKFE